MQGESIVALPGSLRRQSRLRERPQRPVLLWLGRQVQTLPRRVTAPRALRRIVKRADTTCPNDFSHDVGEKDTVALFVGVE